MLNTSHLSARFTPRFRLLVLVPAYDEEASIASLIHKIKGTTQALPQEVTVEILVVDDCSEDRTAELVTSENVSLLRLPINLGYGGALRAGYTYAVRKAFDAVVQLDGDGQHDPDSIPELVEPVRRGEADAVLGSRWMSPHEYHMPRLRRAGQWFFRNVIYLLGGGKVEDATSGYQVLSQRVFRMFANEEFPADYPDANALLWLRLAGLRVVEMPALFHSRVAGRSIHSGLLRPLLYALKMIPSMVAVALRSYFGLERRFNEPRMRKDERIP